MNDFVTLAALTNVGYAAIALITVFFVLRYFDHRMGFSFKKWLDHLDSEEATPAERAGLALYLGMRIMAVCLLMGLLLGCVQPASARPLSYEGYDAEIQRAAKLYLPGVDWRLWKAQLYQESRLNPEAVSPVGAAGVAQFMPKTWREVTSQLGWSGVSPHDASLAIQAGAYYMAQMRRFWRIARPEENRHSLACASYNAGAGNIRKAQTRFAYSIGDAGAFDWKTVLDTYLPRVTGRHAKETQTYVRRIWSHYGQLLAMR